MLTKITNTKFKQKEFWMKNNMNYYKEFKFQEYMFCKV